MRENTEVKWRIPADKAWGIAEAAEAVQAQSRELGRIQLVQRVRFLEGFIAAMGVDLDSYIVVQAADGSLELREKPAPEEAAAAAAG